METFKTETSTIRRLLKGEIDEEDRTKNFFIPPYQRKYDWSEDQVIKLIDDIFEQSNKKEGDSFSPYFIGGIVLSQQSMLGEIRSNKSLEVIDGQQRLTTIILILSSIVQVLKFQSRLFEKEESVTRHLINDITRMIKIEDLNLNTMILEEKFVLERSDNLKKDFELIITLLLEEKIYENKQFLEKLNNNDDSKKLVTLVNAILDRIQLFEDTELLDFTIQMLNYTWIVVTKTISVETGFFIFEKLNDSGIALEPQDLLKNYLFRTSSEKEYLELTKKWDRFLEKVKVINSTKSKILPRDFLEQYLTLTGNVKDSTSKKKVFKQLQKIHSNNFEKSMDLLDDLMLLADEYYILKRHPLSNYLNAMNFKIGYLILLSFFKKYGKSYLEYKSDLLIIVVRLGLVYLITGKSKELSNILPSICSEIINKGKTIEETLLATNSFINSSLLKKKEALDEVISNTNLWRKKPLTRLLLSIVEYHISGKELPLYFNICQIMPQEYSSNCRYEGINEDNYIKYSNYIGNILIDDENIYNNECLLSYSNIKLHNNDSNNINNLETEFKIKDNNIVLSNISVETWGKSSIIERSQMISELSNFILLENNNFDKNFFKNLDR